MKHLPDSLEELLPKDLLLGNIPDSIYEKKAHLMSMFLEDTPLYNF